MVLRKNAVKSCNLPSRDEYRQSSMSYAEELINVDGIYAAAGVRCLLGGRGRLSARGRPRKAAKNQAVKTTAKNMARNPVYYAQLLRDHPLQMKAMKT
jgi:hypothetical protein